MSYDTLQGHVDACKLIPIYGFPICMDEKRKTFFGGLLYRIIFFFRIIEAAVKYNYVTDFTSLYLENSGEFEEGEYFFKPTLSANFGLGSHGGRSLDDDVDLGIFTTEEFCAEPKYFINANYKKGVIERGPRGTYDSHVSVKFNVKDTVKNSPNSEQNLYHTRFFWKLLDCFF